MRLIHYFEDENNVYLILELAAGGNLYEFLYKRKQPMQEAEAFRYFIQAALAIDYLHKHNILRVQGTQTSHPASHAPSMS